ncbi:hypothetical protein OJE16_18905 [Pantoea tagorei]
MHKLSCLTIALGLLMSVASQAEAKGCLEGAAVGGAAGHIKDHALIGAAAGCAVGHHMAHKKSEKGRGEEATADAVSGLSGRRARP